jgi:hypothetical protein
MEDFREEGQNNYSKRIALNPRFNWFLSDPMITKIIPHTHTDFGPAEEYGIEDSKVAQLDLFWHTYDELEEEEAIYNNTDMDKHTISGKKLEERLISTGKFYNGDADRMIKEMMKAGKLKEVMMDTYIRI